MDTRAPVRAERVAGWFRTPLIVAALLAIPVIGVQEYNPGGAWNLIATALDWCIWGYSQQTWSS